MNLTKKLYAINGIIPETLLKDLFLDYYNNYLTVDKFAMDKNLTEKQAYALINRGKYLHNRDCKIK